MKDLEAALKALQQAKRLNDAEQLDGDACKACQSMADYEALFAKMMAQLDGLAENEGPSNFKGPGHGKGGVAPENDGVETGFKTERSPTTIQKGKILLSLKSKGVGEEGDVKQEYRQLLGDIRQGVSEAILQEQIPPGYHDGIKSYFDSLRGPENEPDAEK